MDFSVIYQLKIKRSWWMDVLLYLVISILIAVIFCYFIFSVKASILKKEIAKEEVALKTVGTEDQKAKEKSVLSYIKKINDFNSIYKNHKLASNAFAFMQQITLPYIWFKQFSLDRNGASIQVSGEANDLDGVSRQIAVFEKNKYIKKVGSISLSPGAEGKTGFGTSLTLDPKIFTYIADLAIKPVAQDEEASSDQPTNTNTATIGAPTKSNQKLITVFDFYLADKEIIGKVDQKNYLVEIEAPYGTDITNLSPSIVISPNATISPASGSARDFTNPIIYKVVAQDGSIQNYKVVVKIAEKSSQTNKPSYMIILIIIPVIVISILSIIGAIVFRKLQTKKEPTNAN